MAFIDEVLYRPSYGWQDVHGNLIKPRTGQLFSEAFGRMNIFKSRKNWISFGSGLMVLCLVPFLYFFLFHFFTWKLAIAFIVYTMIVMGTWGTIWHHRYSTHHAYKFSHPFWRIITQNLVIRTLPEEIYVVSHHVHHSKSDLPGDPYNAQAGFWYCMLAEWNHQRISPTLSETDYKKVVHFMRHTGVPSLSYSGYQQWGSVTPPWYAITMWLLNWSFWYTTFFLIGGHALAVTLFSAALVWFVGVRAFNYTGHGSGEIKHVEGIDFDTSNLSVNQWRPGMFAGEWHNNHHLYPGSARAGFLPYQLDLPWIYIYSLYKMGAVSQFRDSKKDFLKRYGKRVDSGQVVVDSSERVGSIE